MSENRPTPPSSEFLASIHPEDLAELQTAALLAETAAAFPSVMRRHGELMALSDWLIEYGDFPSTKQETRDKEQMVENIAASFFLDASGQVEALVEDYEDKVFVGEI